MALQYTLREHVSPSELIRLISSLLALAILSSCASVDAPTLAAKRERAESEVDQYELMAFEEGSAVKDSLPELRYLRQYPPDVSFARINLHSVEGQAFTIHLLRTVNAPYPGNEFTLAYLADADGKLVDWKSQWLYTRQGSLEDKVLDLNGDGVSDLCFIARRLREPDQFLSGYCVKGGRFAPVIAERAEWFTLEFKPATIEGLVIEVGTLKNFQWKTQKISEIPVKITNRSARKVDLRGRAVGLEGNGIYGGGGPYEPLPVESINPGETIESFVDYRFSVPPTSRMVSFVLERYLQTVDDVK